MWCEEYEKNLVDEILKKRVLNGSVPLLADTSTHDELSEQCAH